MQPKTLNPLIELAKPFTVSEQNPLELVDAEGHAIARFASEHHSPQELEGMAALAGLAYWMAGLIIADGQGANLLQKSLLTKAEASNATERDLPPLEAFPHAPMPWTLEEQPDGGPGLYDANGELVAVLAPHAKLGGNLRLLNASGVLCEVLRGMLQTLPPDILAENAPALQGWPLVRYVYGLPERPRLEVVASR